jgi:hypothetical protein
VAVIAPSGSTCRFEACTTCLPPPFLPIFPSHRLHFPAPQPIGFLREVWHDLCPYGAKAGFTHDGIAMATCTADRIAPGRPRRFHGETTGHGLVWRRLSADGAQAAKLVAQVLKGAKPSETSIQTPEKFILAIHLPTAKAIGLEIPRAVLEKTDRLVE